MTTPHAHYWKIDGHGLGACACGEAKRFAPSWESAWARRPTRDRLVVARELAELHRRERNIRPTESRASRMESRLRQRM